MTKASQPIRTTYLPTISYQISVPEYQPLAHAQRVIAPDSRPGFL